MFILRARCSYQFYRFVGRYVKEILHSWLKYRPDTILIMVSLRNSLAGRYFNTQVDIYVETSSYILGVLITPNVLLLSNTNFLLNESKLFLSIKYGFEYDYLRSGVIQFPFGERVKVRRLGISRQVVSEQIIKIHQMTNQNPFLQMGNHQMIPLG